MRALKTFGWLCIAAAAACGSSNNNNTNTPDAGSGTGSPDAPAGAMGTSFANAIDITSTIDGGAGTPTTLPNASSKQYFKATLNAGDRYILSTNSNAETTQDGTVTDTVVTLYDSTMTAIAQDDDAWPRGSTDSALFFYSPAAGTFYITVEDCNSAFGSTDCAPASGITDFAYTLFLNHTSKLASPEVNAAATQDGTTAHAQTITYAIPSGGKAGDYGDYILDGLFTTAGATHVYSFTVPKVTILTGERAHAEFWVQPISAKNGDGSTSNVKAWVTASDGTTVLSSADQTNFKDGDNATDGPLDLEVPVVAGSTYYLFVKDDSAASKPTTDYYFIVHSSAGDLFYGQIETKETATAKGGNDSMATAEKLAKPSDATVDGFFADGNVGVAGDVDWWEADPPAGDTKVELDCAATRQGSGVGGIQATLYAADGTTMIGSIGPETATTDLYKASISVPANTTAAYLKVSASSTQDATDTGTFYRCDIVYGTM